MDLACGAFDANNIHEYNKPELDQDICPGYPYKSRRFCEHEALALREVEYDIYCKGIRQGQPIYHGQCDDRYDCFDRSDESGCDLIPEDNLTVKECSDSGVDSGLLLGVA